MEVGNYVELDPASDWGKRGGRYGTVKKIGKKWIHVRLNIFARTVKLKPEDVTLLLGDDGGPMQPPTWKVYGIGEMDDDKFYAVANRAPVAFIRSRPRTARGSTRSLGRSAA